MSRRELTPSSFLGKIMPRQRILLDIGQKIHAWTVLARVENSLQGNTMYRVQCECGTVREHRGYQLLRAAGPKSCRECSNIRDKGEWSTEEDAIVGSRTDSAASKELGRSVTAVARRRKALGLAQVRAYKPRKRKVLRKGARFGAWKVLDRADDEPGTGKTRYLCRCKCGTEKVILHNTLVRGLTTKCRACFAGDTAIWATLSGKPVGVPKLAIMAMISQGGVRSVLERSDNVDKAARRLVSSGVAKRRVAIAAMDAGIPVRTVAKALRVSIRHPFFAKRLPKTD